MNNLPISVIIAAKNAEGTIEECLVSVQGNNPAEIIVVDGNSTDRTLEIARRFTDLIYSDENKGFNYAQQLGAEHATQEYIALVDTDITLPECTLVTLLTQLKVSNYVSMQATILGANLNTYWERAGDWSFQIFQARRGISLSAAVLKRDIVIKYKLNSALKFSSDYDFKIRMEKEGYKLGTSSAVVYHHHRADLKSFTKQRFRFGCETIPFILKHGLWAARLGPPATRVYWIIRCLIHGKPNFVPYFIVDGFVQIAGMMKGLIEFSSGNLKKRRK
jgi:glycosyltransferase involved in cell wall biosynthesis